MPNYLPNQTIHDLLDAILSAGLNTPDVRDELLSGINAGYVATLPLRGNALDQIHSDLNEMNRVPFLKGNEVPLQIWLENAVQRLRRSFRHEQDLFQRVLNEVSAKRDTIGKSKNIDAPPPRVEGGVERIVHQDDLLPYGWLQGAMAIGVSVARLTVPRYDNGQARFHPGSTIPVRHLGTGWLIGPQHLITNHHVINARSEGEGNASESDLRKQVEKITIQFDYDAENAAGSAIEGASLEAWVPAGSDPNLDFAVLKLPEPSSRAPLPLAPQALNEATNGYLPVNIVQHPGGAPKMLGVRNNLVSAIDDHALSYYTDTMRGSSGSPVCNDRWQVIALHRAWEFVHTGLSFQGKETAWRNVGVRIDRIIEHLRQNHPALWTAIGARVM